MLKRHLVLNEIPADGQEFLLEDDADWAAFWRERFEEFGLAYALAPGLTGRLRVQPVQDGFLLSGHLAGALSVPCDRCALDARVEVAAEFSEFEYLAGLSPAAFEEGGPGVERPSRRHSRHDLDDETEVAEELDEKGHVEKRGGEILLDVGGFFWEQLNLALPVKPLCSETCTGLCPQCGEAAGSCSCSDEEPDPRMAALRGLKLQ